MFDHLQSCSTSSLQCRSLWCGDCPVQDKNAVGWGDVKRCKEFIRGLTQASAFELLSEDGSSSASSILCPETIDGMLRWCKANNSNIQCSSMLQSHGSFLQVWLYPQYPQYCIPSCFAVCLKLSEILPGLDDISDSWNGDRSLCNVRRQNNFPTPRCWYDRSSVLVACNSCQVQRRWPATATGGQLQQLGGEPWRSLLKHKLLGQVKTGPARTTSSQHIFAFSACLLIERQGGVYWSYQEVLHLGHDWSLLMSNDNHWKSITSFLLGRVTCSKVGHVFIPKEKLPGERGALGLCQAHL